MTVLERNENANKWELLLQKAADSDLTVEQWCVLNHVSKRQYYYWKRRLRMLHGSEQGQPDAGSANPIPKETVSPGSTAGFIEVPDVFYKAPISAGHDTVPSEFTPLVLRQGTFQILIRDGFSKDCLASLLEVLRYAE